MKNTITSQTFLYKRVLKGVESIIKDVNNLKNRQEHEALRVRILGKKGVLTEEFAKLKDLPKDEKIKRAEELNRVKNEFLIALQDKLEELKLEDLKKRLEDEKIDVSLYSHKNSRGALHPVSSTMSKIIEYFLCMNFGIESGPLVEDEFYNFEALNIEAHHPARDMQDTFYFKDGKLLRTHTSPVQIRTMKKETPPIRIISPGAVFRRDYDLTHTPMFHQVEGLVVDKEGAISFSNLKYILEDFLVYMFGDVDVRFRTSFFPFTEPSAEVDISCIFCKGSGCRVCKKTGWLEVLGCGLVDENVFKAVGYKNVSGYAFGLGVERFAMLIHSVNDLRSFFETDLRVLEQFR